MHLPIKVNGILVHNCKILVIKRSKEDGGFWQTVTGTLEEGETLKQALIREIEEEVGISPPNVVEISDVVYKFVWDKNGWPQTEYVFVVKVSTDKVTLSTEHTDYTWLPPAEAIKRVKTKNNKEAIKAATKPLGKRKLGSLGKYGAVKFRRDFDITDEELLEL